MARYEETEKRQIVCSKCGNEGEVTFEEPANPVYHGEDSRIGSVSGFKVKGSRKVACIKCGTEVTI